MDETFPHRPVRGVSVRYGTVANCFPDFVSFSLDFEPLADGRVGYEFVSDLDYGFDEYSHELHAECAPAISQGVLLNLTGAPQAPNQLTADVDIASLPVGRLDNAEGGPRGAHPRPLPPRGLREYHPPVRRVARRPQGAVRALRHDTGPGSQGLDHRSPRHELTTRAAGTQISGNPLGHRQMTATLGRPSRPAEHSFRQASHPRTATITMSERPGT